MHFKISLVICSVYFFAAVWSVGLSQSDINTIVELVENYRKKNYGNLRITMKEYMQTDMDYNGKFHNNVDECVYKLDGVAMIDDESLPDLLVYLAKLDKLNDDWRGKTMTTYEVNIFMTIFKEKDKIGWKISDGLLTHAELVNLIDVDFNLEPDFENKIKKEFKDGDLINALMFMAAIIKHKPEGRGLDKKQLKKCSDLYKTFYGYLSTKPLKALLQTADIVSKDYFQRLKFDHDQHAALELQELLVFWSEYNKDVKEDSMHLSSTDVRHHIYEFSLFDFENDGVLSYSEFQPVSKQYLPKDKKNAKAFLYKSGIWELKSVVKLNYLAQKLDAVYCSLGNHDDNNSMNSATFLYMKYYLIFGQNESFKTKLWNGCFGFFLSCLDCC